MSKTTHFTLFAEVQHQRDITELRPFANQLPCLRHSHLTHVWPRTAIMLAGHSRTRAIPAASSQRPSCVVMA